MLLPHPFGQWSVPDTMSTRTAALITIGLTVVLMAVVALASLFVLDISERAGTIVSDVLGKMALVLTGLLVFLRLETLNTKTDDAAEKAAVAAEKAATVERKVDRVHDDVLNGPMRANVKRAIAEAEADPQIVERRIDTIAKGVQADRHDLKNRKQRERLRNQLRERGVLPRENQP